LCAAILLLLSALLLLLLLLLLLPGGGIGEPGGQLFPVFNALTDGDVTWAALPDTYDRI